MWREFAFRLSSGRRSNYVAERFVPPWTAKSAGAPFSQIVLNTALDWFSKNKPGFPHRSRHDADIGKFIMSGFRTIATAHGRGQTNNFTSPLKAGIRQRSGHQVRY